MGKEEKYVLSDKEVYPDDLILFSHLGAMKNIWLSVLEFMKENYKDSAGEWRYYNDGKQWLFKMVFKKKTVFWAALMEGTFRITFYFTGKATSIIENGSLTDTVKESFKNAKSYGALRPVSIAVAAASDLEDIYELVRIKTTIK